MKKLLSIIFCLIIIPFLFSGCQKKEETLKTIRVNEVTHSIFYAPFYVAIENGFFEKEGIKIELTNGGGSNVSMTAVLSNRADVGLVGPETAVFVYNEGKNDYPIIFSQLTKRDGSFLISRENEKNFDYSQLVGKEILAGRRGGMPAMTLEYVLNQHGLYNGENITLNYDVAFNMMAGAFEGGTADYTTLFEPTASDFVTEGKGFIVASIGLDSGEVPYTCFVATRKYLEENTELLISFNKALYSALDYIKNTDSGIVAECLAKSFPSTSVETIEKTLIRHLEIDAWVDNFAMKEEAFYRMQDIMENAGELESRVNFSSLVYNDLAKEAYSRQYE